MDGNHRRHAARNVASVLSYAFLLPEVALYREEAEQAGIAHSVYVGDKVIDIILREWRRFMGQNLDDPIRGIIGRDSPIDPDAATDDHPHAAILGEVCGHLKAAFESMCNIEVQSMRPEDWHAMTAICKAGRVTAMVRAGYALSFIARKEDDREW